MVDPDWVKRKKDAAQKMYGVPTVLPIPDVSVGDKVKITEGGAVGAITKLQGGYANVKLDSGQACLVPVRYLEKA